MRQVLEAGWQWDAGELTEREFVAAVWWLLPAQNFADFMAGREAARR